jgi:glycosyltransferase involved in cell wall biosynthesis
MHVFGGAVRSGVESVVLSLADAVRDAGGSVIMTPLVDGEFTAELRELGYRVEPLGKKRRLDFFSIPRLAGIIRRCRPDIVHCHAVNGAFYACPAGRMAGCRSLVATFHAHTAESLLDAYRWPVLRRLAHRYHVLVSRMCHRLIAVSPQLRRSLVRDGAPAGRLVFIPNGISLQTFDRALLSREASRELLNLPADAQVIGVVCRIAPIKNLPMLLRAAAQLMPEYPRLRVVLAGDGPDRPAVGRLAEELGIADRVHLLGWRADVGRVLPAFDVYALTSHSEGMPVSVLEAMAASSPVVATNVGGVPELIEHGRTGLLVPDNDVPGLTSLLRDLLAAPDWARELGSAGRRHVEQSFDVAVTTQQVIQLYNQLLAQARVPLRFPTFTGEVR